MVNFTELGPFRCENQRSSSFLQGVHAIPFFFFVLVLNLDHLPSHSRFGLMTSPFFIPLPTITPKSHSHFRTIAPFPLGSTGRFLTSRVLKKCPCPILFGCFRRIVFSAIPFSLPRAPLSVSIASCFFFSLNFPPHPYES